MLCLLCVATCKLSGKHADVGAAVGNIGAQAATSARVRMVPPLVKQLVAALLLVLLLAHRLTSVPGYIALALAAAYAFTFFDGSEARPRGRFSRTWHQRFARWGQRYYASRGLGPDVLFEDGGRPSPDSQYIFAVHPHGVASFCHLATWLSPAFLACCPAEQRRALGASSLFMVPFLRDIILACGGVAASRPVASACLREGYSLTVVPGGEREQINTRHGAHSVYLRRRKGFCRLALAHGVPLVPVYCFGETDTYRTSAFALGFRRWLAAATTIALPLAFGPSWLNPLRPFPSRLTLVVGAPLPTPPPGAAPPTEQQVDELHAAYVRALTELFERRKAQLGYGSAKLVVV